MKIIKYRKVKNNQYQIQLNNKTEIYLYEDIIIKEELLRKKEISLKELNRYLEQNDEYEAYYEILKFLKKKMRCEKEIIHRFQNIYPERQITKIIEILKQEKYLDNDKYLKAYINDQILLKLNGPLKIKSELLALGFLEEDIDLYLFSISNDVWLVKIKKLVTKNLKANQKGLNHFFKKIRLDLLNRGFCREMIDEYLESLDLKENNDLLIKAYKKLQIKYQDDYIVKNKLLMKGFSKEDIERILAKEKL